MPLGEPRWDVDVVGRQGRREVSCGDATNVRLPTWALCLDKGISRLWFLTPPNNVELLWSNEPPQVRNWKPEVTVS